MLYAFSCYTSRLCLPKIPFFFIPKAQQYAQINGLMGDLHLEQTYHESARSILETKIQQQPEDPRFHSALGIAYAGLGRKEDALREGKLGVQLLLVTKEAMRGLFRVEDLARIYMIGEFDAAIDRLEFLLSRPGWMSIPLLRLDPAWPPYASTLASRDWSRQNSSLTQGRQAEEAQKWRTRPKTSEFSQASMQ